MSKKFSKAKFIYRAYKYRYVEDKAELDYITRSINKGDTVLDIGSHKGGYLYWLRKSVGKEGFVFAFEPQITLFTYLQNFISIYDFKNIDLKHAGVSSKKGLLNLFIPNAIGLTSPEATFEQKSPNEEGYYTEVQVLQIDEFLNDRKSKVSLIKIDVEGHELEVFKGAIDLLKTDRPKLIFECENRHLNNSRVEDVFDFLKQLNYQGFFFYRGRKTPIEQFEASKHQVTSSDKQIINKKEYCNNFVFEPLANA